MDRAEGKEPRKESGEEMIEAEYRSAAVHPEGEPDRHMYAARIVTYGVPDQHGTSWQKGVFTESLERKKPSSVWGHDERRPIGRVVDYRDSDEGLDVIVKMADPEAVPDSKMALSLLDDDIINEFSFRFVRESDETDPDHRGVMRITKARLEEVSPVLVASGTGTKTLAVRSTTRAQATDLLNRVAAGELDAQEALALLVSVSEGRSSEDSPIEVEVRIAEEPLPEWRSSSIDIYERY